MRIVLGAFIGTLISFAALQVPGSANEPIRPETPADYSSELGMTVESSVEVRGTAVAWANYPAIRRDFPAIRHFTDQQINEWLIQNFSFIGASQSDLNGLRNSTIDTGPRRKPAFRPDEWKRSAVLEAVGPDGSPIGMVDIKGFGHGAQTYQATHAQVEKFNYSKGSAKEIDALRIANHSDGLMSMGEAIAETTRQRAAQMLFEMSGSELETVESYAILALPFDILKNGNQTIPAALYLRQAHVGRTSGLSVPPSIYTDEAGHKQMTATRSAIDFGGVTITDERLKKNFGSAVARSVDPQESKPWMWGHETAAAWKRGDHRAVYKHVNEMLAPIEEAYKNSPEVKAHALENLERKISVYFAWKALQRVDSTLQKVGCSSSKKDRKGSKRYQSRYPSVGCR